MEILFAKDWLESQKKLKLQGVFEPLDVYPKSLDVEKELTKILMEEIEKLMTPEQKEYRKRNDQSIIEWLKNNR